MVRFSVSSLVILALVALATGVTPYEAEASWKPRKPIALVVMAGKGGGADRLARVIQGIIEKNNFSPKPLVLVNKGAGSGAEALQFLRSKAGDNHVLMATLNSYYTTPLRQKALKVDIANFTPIARMAEDTFQLWVHADSPVKTLDDYVAMVRKVGKKWKMAGTGKGAEDSLVTAMLERKFGIEVSYIPYRGGGKVAKELIGKHVQSTVNNPSEQAGYWAAGQSRPLASFTPKGKLKGKWGEIPTFEELGHGTDMVYYMQRSIVAPADIADEVRFFYTALFKKVYQSQDWQNYLEKKGLIPGWLTGDELQEYFLAERARHAKLMER